MNDQEDPMTEYGVILRGRSSIPDSERLSNDPVRQSDVIPCGRSHPVDDGNICIRPENHPPVQQCSKAGCGATTVDPTLDGWHVPVAGEDPRDGHNINALILCPGHWASAQLIGFTL